MKPSVALEMKRQDIRDAVARYPIINPRIFGSVLHGDDRDGSDLDILVDALPGATLLHLGGLTEELSELLGVRVDVRTPQELSEKFREQVVAEARPV